jgi:hypothetical protein
MCMRIAFAIGLLLALIGCGRTAAGQRSVSGGNAIARVPARAKRSEVARASVGPTAVQIYANPRKWKGAYVRLDCEIIRVSQAAVATGSTADARCGRGVAASLDDYPTRATTKEYNRVLGDQALFVLAGDHVSQLGAGQDAKIVGRVMGLSALKNGAGMTSNLVTVRVDDSQI